MTMRRVLQAALLMSSSMAALAGDRPQIPTELTPPAGAKQVLKAHATGSQIYTCKAGNVGAFQWVLKGPDADLHDKRGAMIGHHSAGPTWKHKDGSEVTGKAAAHVASPDGTSIPWLLLTATGHEGKGKLANVTSIHRVNTLD